MNYEAKLDALTRKISAVIPGNNEDNKSWLNTVIREVFSEFPPPPSGSMAAKDARELLAKLRKGTGHVAPGEHHPFAPAGYWVEWDLSIHDALMAIQDYAARGQEEMESEREYIATLKEKLHHTEQRANIAEAEEQRVKAGLGTSLQNWLDLKNRAEQAESGAKALREAIDEWGCAHDHPTLITEIETALRKDEAEKVEDKPDEETDGMC
jgi:hypothetical protein